jgi:uncharacterized protein (UPF0335 family)
MTDGNQLRAIVERIEALEAEKRDIAEGIKEVYSEAGGSGFDKAIIRQIVARRKKRRDELQEQEELLAIYEAAINA